MDWSAAPANASVPVLMVTSWYDHFVPWQLADWASLGSGASPRRLVIAPWVHEDARLLKLYLRESLAWLDAHLRGADPAARGQTVRYFLTGADQWVDAPTWPPPGGEEQRWYLHPSSLLAPEEPPSGAATSRFTYNPAEPTPSIGGPSARRQPQADQAAIENRSDVACFTSEALRQPVDIVGTVTARVHVRSSPQHADLVVRVCDVDPSGRSIHICDGIRRLTPGEHPDERGEREVDVELWPAGHRLAAGHRIRVQLTGGAFPRFDRNSGTGAPSTTAARLVPVDLEVLHDAHHPSFVCLPTRPMQPSSSEVARTEVRSRRAAL